MYSMKIGNQLYNTHSVSEKFGQVSLLFFSLGAFKIADMYLLIKTHYYFKKESLKKKQRRRISNKKWQKSEKNNLHNWIMRKTFHIYRIIFSKSHYILKPKTERTCSFMPTKSNLMQKETVQDLFKQKPLHFETRHGIRF